MISVLYLVLGFVLLVKGADFFVDGSSAIAKRLGIPSRSYHCSLWYQRA